MQKKIRQLAEGRIRAQRGTLSFSEPEVVLEVRSSGTATGEFFVSRTDGKKVRGVVFSSNPRMELVNEGFEGEEPRIRFQFNSKGLSQGDTVHGHFSIVSDCGEGSLPFVVSVKGLSAETSVGLISDLDEFVALYDESPNEAFKLFYSSHFSEILRDVKHQLYYKGFASAAADFSVIDEFLYAVGKKEKPEFEIYCPLKGDNLISEEVEDVLTLEKNGKGIISVELSSNHPAVSFLKNYIRDEDFIGSVADTKIHINPEKFTPGLNKIIITAKSKQQEKSVEFFARGSEVSEIHSAVINSQLLKKVITKEYIEYRLKQMSTGEWASRTLRNLDSLIAQGGATAWYNLMKAQVYIANRQKQEALMVLRDFKNERFDRDTCIWAYYLYLSTLVEKERAYVERLTSEIEGIFKHNPEDERLFWMLLFLRQDYQRDSGKKFSALRHWIENGHASAFLYVEAYFLIWQNPALLSNLEGFNLSILRWANRHDALTKDLVIQLTNLVNLDKGFSKRAYDLLLEGYRKYPSEEILSVLVSYIIRSGQKSEEYLPILREAIDAKISITGIYEAYLGSLKNESAVDIPRALTLYFAFDHNLSDELKELLYANVILNKNNEHEIYVQYSHTIEVFALNAMLKGRINDNLAIIYNDLLDKNFISEDIAQHMSKILLAKRITTLNNDVSLAIIYSEPFNNPILAEVKDGGCYVNLPSDDFVVIFQEKNGYRYAEKEPFCTNLFEVENSFYRLSTLCPESVDYAVKRIESKAKSGGFSREDSMFFETLLFSRELTKEYIAKLHPLWLHYLADNLQDDELELQLRNNIDLTKLSAEDRGFCIGLLIDYHMDDEAFLAIRDFGSDYVPASKLILLISFLIEREDMEYDDELFFFARSLFAEGNHNTIIAQYLTNHFIGSLEDMTSLYSIAKTYSIETFELSERILTFMLFSETTLENRMEIFEDYFVGHPTPELVEAFLTVECHSYITKEIKPSDRLLSYLMNFRDQKLNDACKIGILKLLSCKEDLTETEMETAEKFLSAQVNLGRNFAFYKDLDYSLIQKYHLYDKTVAEYRGEQRKTVLIHYEDGGKMVEEEMTECYPGVYTKTFVLFFGEEKEYFVSVFDEDGEHNEPPRKLRCRDIVDRPSLNKYEKLNHLAMDLTLENVEKLNLEIKEFNEIENVANELFTLIG